MPFSCAVFDFDGLILDTELPEFVTVRQEFAAHGVTLELEDWQQIVGRADHRHWLDWLEDELGHPLANRTLVLERRRARHHELIRANTVRDGVVALLDEADALGVPVAVASSSDTAWVEGHLDRLGLLDRFAAVRTRDHVARAKPWPDVFLAACAALDADPGAGVAFEDSHHGARAARAAGLAVVVAPNEVTASQDFGHADLVVPSLAEVRLADLPTRLASAPAESTESGEPAEPAEPAVPRVAP